MRIWFTRVFAFVFVLSLMAPSQMAVLATGDEPLVGTEQNLDSDEASATPDDFGDFDDGVGENPEGDAGLPGDGSGSNEADDLKEDSGSEKESTGDAENTDDASSEDNPVGDETDDLVDDTDAVEGKPEGDDGEQATPEKMNTTMSGEMQPMVSDFSGFTFSSPYFDLEDGVLRTTFNVLADTEIVAGQTLQYTYDSEHITLHSESQTFPPVDGGSFTVSVNQTDGTITVEFTEDFQRDFHSTWSFDVSGRVDFPECRLDTSFGYTNYVSVTYGLPNGEVSWPQWLYSDEECPGTGLPSVSWGFFMPFAQSLDLGMEVPGIPAAGHEITITYPQDAITISPDPVDIYLWSDTDSRDVKVATAIASDGVITITFLDVDDEGDWNEYANLHVRAWLSNEVCDPDLETYLIESRVLEFVPSAGSAFEVDLPERLCNAVPPSMSGEWSEDGERIIWTIDTGQIMQDSDVRSSFPVRGFTFDCDTLTVDPPISVSGGTEYCNADDNVIEVVVYSDDISRATITVEGIPDPDYTPASYVHCAMVVARMFMPGSVSPQPDHGHGGVFCAEVLPQGGGDSISLEASTDSVYPGDSLTYTITVSTTSDFWYNVDVLNALPDEFEISSITCTITPELYQTDPCSVMAGENVLAARALANPQDYYDDETLELPFDSGPVTIVLVVEGTLIADPGTVIVNEVCSQRMIDPLGPPIGPIGAHVGDSTVPGGGVICASVSTLVLQADEPDPDPTETPSPPATPDPTGTPDPTVTPTVPVDPVDPVDPSPEPTAPATPGVTPTTPADPDPTATSAVTGLPETGSGAGASTMLLGVLAASMLMVAAVGIRIRSLRA